MIMYCAQDARRNHYTERGNKHLKSVEKFKYLGTTLTNQNCMHKEIKAELGEMLNNIWSRIWCSKI
jgi:hypothetical protein